VGGQEQAPHAGHSSTSPRPLGEFTDAKVVSSLSSPTVNNSATTVGCDDSKTGVVVAVVVVAVTEEIV